MDLNLTKDGQRLVAAAYKEYLEKRKSGINKANAKIIYPKDVHEKYFKGLTVSDYNETVSEICRAFDCRKYMDGAFCLNDSAIVYMENRFKNGIVDAMSFLAQFIP